MVTIPRLIHQRFEDRAKANPERPALVAGTEELSYGELDRRSRGVARRLRRLGAGPEEVVAFCLPRSADSLVALLGTLRAGAAYSPLDPTLPDERLRAMTASLRTRYLVTDSTQLERLPAVSHTVCLDRDEERTAAGSRRAAGRPVRRGHLVYVLFTSGSTGSPKAVAVEHRQLLNYVDGLSRRLDLPASFAAVTTLAADVSLTAVFPTLATGGCLHLIDRQTALDPAALSSYFARHRIDYLKIVPSHLAALLDSPRAAEILPRRGIVLGGEPLTWRLVDRLRQLDGSLRVINSYGPTETTVAILMHQIRDEPRTTATVPLGRPLPNTRIRLLAPGLELASEGAAGELHVAGASLSRGYLGRPAATAARFVPDPWSDEAGGRLYRTGDRVRRHPAERLEFLDRIDRQVKIRGFRVEPGEIETVLAAHPSVDRAIVLAVGDRPADRRLVAYVLATETGETAEPERLASTLRRHARRRLPEHMVPSSLQVLDRLPLTLNGKVDRAELARRPLPVSERAPSAAPRSRLEEIVAGLWSEVLGDETVGADDDFASLGGHSLLAMQLGSRIREVCGVELPVSSLLGAQTVARQAREIERQGLHGEGLTLPPLTAEPISDPLPLSLAQERYWTRRSLERDGFARNDLAAYRLVGVLDPGILGASLARIVARHEILRTSYAEKSGRSRQIVSSRVVLRMPRIDLDALEPERRRSEIERLARLELARPFDLEQPPLLRPRLFRCAEGEHVLLLVVHHIAFDGWSAQLFRRELSTIYAALRRGAPLPPAPPLQYRHFAAWQRRCLEAGQRSRQLSYWRRNLEGVAPTPELPLDRRHPRRQSFRGGAVALDLDTTLSARLRSLSIRQGATLFMTLLAAFKALLYLKRPQEDLAVLSLFANRNRPELEDMLGCFMNALPLRTRVTGETRFTELVGRVRQATLGAFSHPDIPLETLVSESVSRRQPTVDELYVFRVLFALQSAPPLLQTGDAELRIERFAIAPIRMYNDLLFFLTDGGDRVGGFVLYNVDVFDAATIRELCRDFVRVLEAAEQAPQRSLAELAARVGGKRASSPRPGSGAEIQPETEPTCAQGARRHRHHRQELTSK